MNIRVKIYKFNNRSFVSLINNNYCPVCPYVSNYINIRLSGLGFNTRVAYINEIKFLLTYFSGLADPINIVQRVQEGVFLKRGEFNAFVSAAKFTSDSKFSNVVNVKHFTDKTLENAIHATNVSNACVKAHTVKGRIKRLRLFLEYLYEQIHADFIAPEGVKQRYEHLNKALKDEQANIRDFDDVCVEFNHSVIPSNIFFKLLEIIHPKSPNNPFKHSKQRNYLIIALFLETGLRRGAIAKLKIEHCKFWGSFDEITITRSPDDKSDPRLHRPSQKTKAHKSYVSHGLMHLIKTYIETIRASFPAAEAHEMVFIAEMNTKGSIGKPISLASINSIFKTLSKKLDFTIHPHLLRHKWNELFTEAAEERGLSNEEMDKLRKYAMGWSRTSVMARVYNEFKDIETIREIQKSRQQQIVNAGYNRYE